jgi:hypothetical protein
MFNANAPIKNSKKNLPSVKAAVQSVSAQHQQAVQAMGGVNALAGVILGVISVGPVTAGQAFNAVSKTMPNMFPAMMQMMQTMHNAMQADCRATLQKILKLLT